MQIKNRDEPAHPMLTVERDAQGRTLPGLTKREYFAIRALQGLLSKPHTKPEFAARDAVKAADDLLEALENANQ